MHAVERARLPSALAEAREQLERITENDVHLVVLTVGEIQVLLLRVPGECDVPRRAGPERFLVEERFLHE